MVPVGDEFVLEALLIIIQCLESGNSFRTRVVYTEAVFLAINYQRITILIKAETIVMEY